ncbi:hypothetical protein EC973_006809 [Apophysomyces ossiformis]|uniref:Heterokaryon incompatibility domain-containing protein n=1 Tax=Apophysomyces ossiformis TaxID=679940 RepID=A0A8H7ELN0_9FUNG|nr:hypothetical protein EC973_006809 [Apophysomyces ossiformis]
MSEIVLLDTGSDFDNIKCISIPFDDHLPEYFAISYRWGVHAEWKARTPNYMASITSISQGNLIKLCTYYRSRIRYLWIDVVCINQADKNHRKMAIKVMDDIYRRAKRIIAVPDLCYCDKNPLMKDITKEDIEAAVIGMGMRYFLLKYEPRIIDTLFDWHEPGTYPGFRLEICELVNRTESLDDKHKYTFWTFDDYTRAKVQVGNTEKGWAFIERVITEWAERAWVISERTIGTKDKKLLIHILRANAVFYWKVLGELAWEIQFQSHAIFDAIIKSKSTKFIDRLFAVLPHTKYKDAKQRLIDEEIGIDSEDDLKWLLFEILDMDGRVELFNYLIQQHGKFYFELPFSLKKNEFRFEILKGDYEALLALIIEPIMMQDGKRALKVTCPFVHPCNQDLGDDFQPSDTEGNSDLILFYGYYEASKNYIGYRYLKLNGVWRLNGSICIEHAPHIWKHGEFLMYL